MKGIPRPCWAEMNSLIPLRPVGQLLQKGRVRAVIIPDSPGSVDFDQVYELTIVPFDTPIAEFSGIRATLWSMAISLPR